VAELIMDLQSVGLRVEAQLETRKGGAGPTDSGMLWIEGVAVTVPTVSDQAHASPYVLRAEDQGYGIYRRGERVAAAAGAPRPKFYDLTTADGVPYWQIGLMHLDSFASTVVQTCTYWATPDQCGFCGIELSLEAGRTIVKKSPASLPRWRSPRAPSTARSTRPSPPAVRRRRPRRPVRGQVRQRRQGELRPAGGGAVRAARTTST
jgi:hypothetical protein